MLIVFGEPQWCCCEIRKCVRVQCDNAVVFHPDCELQTIANNSMRNIELLRWNNCFDNELATTQMIFLYFFSVLPYISYMLEQDSEVYR